MKINKIFIFFLIQHKNYYEHKDFKKQTNTYLPRSIRSPVFFETSVFFLDEFIVLQVAHYRHRVFVLRYCISSIWPRVDSLKVIFEGRICLSLAMVIRKYVICFRLVLKIDIW